MRLFNSVGPNPHVVRMFAAEKGIALELVPVDIRAGENRQAPYLSTNPFGQTPALAFDDGTILTESTVICEYLDEVGPGPSLIGEDARARAETRMWVRRNDLGIVEPMAMGFRSAEGLAMFKDRMTCLPQVSDELKGIAKAGLAKLDGLMAGKTYLCGDRFTLADIHLFVWLNFAARVGQAFDPANAHLASWFERIKARPSAAA